MSMIRKTSLAAAAVLAAAMMPAQGANAGTTLNGQISQIINALHNGGHFSPTDFTFSIDTAGGATPLFSGIAGVRDFNDFQTLNDWVGQPAPAPSIFSGGSYVFTHSALGSYFDQLEQPAPTAAPAAARYQAAIAATPQFVAPPAPSLPVPEPTTWAMMIGGLTLVGIALRRSRASVSFV